MFTADIGFCDPHWFSLYSDLDAKVLCLKKKPLYHNDLLATKFFTQQWFTLKSGGCEFKQSYFINCTYIVKE